MTYSCTNPACGWRGNTPGLLSRNPHKPRKLYCPECKSEIEDLDLLERKAIRQDAGFSEEDAERLAREDLEKWEKEKD